MFRCQQYEFGEKMCPKTCKLINRRILVWSTFFPLEMFFFYCFTVFLQCRRKLMGGFPLISPGSHKIALAFCTMVVIDLG